MHIDSLSKYLSFDAGNGGECFFSKETFKYFMQRTKALELERINEGWRNLMPEIVPINLGLNDLVDLRLRCISQLQRLFDTNGSQFPNVLSNLVVLDLDDMENLEVLFHGSLSFDSLKNLEKVSIKECKKLRILFNCNLNLCNLKTVTLWGCPLLVDLSPMLTSRNMVMLEELKISGCEGLKNLVIDEGDNDDKSHGPMFPKLRVLYIARCDRLELIFPFLSIQDLPVLEVIDISHCEKLKYVFGKYQNVEHSSLKEIKLLSLTNFMGIFPENSLVNKSSSTSRDGFKALSQVDPIKCNLLSWSGICCHEDPLQNNSSASVSNSHDRLQIREHAQCFQVRLLNLCNVKNITLHGILKIKSVFILSITPRMMVETLSIMDCDDLKHIIVDIGDNDSGGKYWGDVFPYLKKLQVHHCKKLEYIFGHHTDEHQNHTKIRLHLPTLECLDLFNLPSLIAMCVKQYTATFPSLKWKFLCSNVAIKSIGVFMVSHSDSESLDNTTEELSGSMDHLIALKSLMVYNSKGEIYFCLNGTKGQPINLGPKNSFALQNLTEIKIDGCEKLEIIFSNSISTCLSQLRDLRIEECKELKHIIEDDDTSNSLSPRIFFPKLKKLIVLKCHKLKCVFPVSICKELPELEILMIREAHELEVIFKSNGDQKGEIPNLNFVVFFDLPSLFDAQGIHFRLEQIRSIENCPKLLSLTSASGFVHRIPNLQDDTSSENSSVETTTNADVGVEIEVEAILGDKLTSSQKLETEQFTSQQGSINLQDLIGKIDTAIKPSQCVKETNEKSIQEDYMTITASTHLELVSSSQTSEQDLDVGDYPKTTKVKDIQGFVHRIPNLQDDTNSENSSVETTTNADVGVEIEVEAILGDKLTSSQKLETEQFTSQQGSINLQDLIGKIDTAIKPSQCVKETNEKSIQEDYMTITASTHLELVSSSQTSEQDLDVGDYPKTTKVKDIQGFVHRIPNLQDDTSSENSSIETTTNADVGVEIEVEAILGDEVTYSQKLQNEQSINQQGSINQQDSLGEIDTAIKPSQCVKETNDQGIQEDYLSDKIVAATISEITNEPPIQLVSPKLKGVEEWAALRNAKTITTSSNLELVGSSQMSEQDVADRYSLETTKVNDDQDFQNSEHFESRFQQLEETTKDVVVGVGTEVEPPLGHKLTSSQIITKQTPQEDHELTENASNLKTPSVAVLVTSSKELEKEQPRSEQGLIKQQDPHGEIDTTIKSSQEQDVDDRDSLEIANVNDNQDFQTREHFESRFKQLEDETKGYNTSNENPSAETTKDIVVGVASEIEAALGHTLTSSQIIMKQTPEVEHELQIPSVTVLPTSSKELKKEQPPSQQRLTNQQNPLGEIDTSIKPSQGVEEGTALTNAKAITASTHSELSRSSQVKEQDVDVRDTLETTVINDDRDSLNEDVVIKESPIIEEQFSKGDGFTILKSKPSPSNSVPMPLSFQAASMDIEGNPSQNVEDLSSAYLVTRKLEELVSNKHLDYENLSLLTDFFVKHPSILLSDKHSNGYKGHAYKFLTKLLKFLQTHSVLDVLGSCNSEFVELVHDVRSFSFDKDWLDGVEKRALFPDLEFSQDSLQKLLDSKKQITEDVEVMRFKIDILTRDVEELKQQLSSSEADLESVIQREKEIVESKVALSVPLGY